MKIAWWRRAAAAIESLPLPLRVVLAFAALLHGCAISWGMPASDGWDVDGVAPRDVLPGLAQTYTPGEFYTYPPLHLAIVALLTLPVTLAAVARAGTTAIAPVIQVILLPPYMTTIAMVARVVSLLMSLGIALSLAKIAEEIAPEGRKRGVMTAVALVASLDTAFTYYAHVTNLDVPYLFWAMLGALSLVRAMTRHEPRRIRHAAVFMALSVATKDQAYAMFLLGAPAVLVAWFATDRWPRAHLRAIAKDALAGVALAAVALAVIDGAVTNPSGFRARLAFLSGSASQDFAMYSRDAAGRMLALLDTAREFPRHYPPILATLFVIGLVDVVRTARRVQGRLAAALVPLALGLSFTFAFNLVARRVEERFTLPQMLGASFYMGFGLERLWCAFASGAAAGAARWPNRVGRAAAVLLVSLALYETVLVDATMLREPRYDAEEWLAQNLRPGDLVETHGLNVYLARFSPGTNVIRVGPEPTDKRNPMPGIREVQAPYSAIAERNPRFVVVNECYVWRFMDRDLGGDAGRIVPSTQKQSASDADATAFFQGLLQRKLGYHLALEARIRSELFPRYHLHASLGCPVFVFERDRPPVPEP